MKILLPVVTSTASRAAVRFVVALCRAGVRVEALVLHVHPPFHRHIAQFTSRAARDAFRAERSRAALAPALEQLVRCGVPCAALTERGTAVERIVAVAERHHVDAIVMGDGRIAEDVMARTRIAVSIVPGRPASALQRYALPAGLGALAALMWAAD